ncbi:PDCD10 and GCKIII kinases-associated protein 1 [Microcebus murinus]|uniref:Uncharacterized protein n=1 Tax=Microcebus murinus TaxID=30608 RepID=A0A8C5Y0N4_MICMU|nr:uncharacterized protein C4orf19 homolog [Microcebus murinus]
MGCRCCKMIQSYLFDPVQVPSPGYVNEVNSCKLDEDDTVKLKGKQSSECLEQRSDPPGEGVRTGSGGRGSGPRPHLGRLPQGDPAGGHCMDGAVNGTGPASAPQPPGSPRSPRDDRGSRAGTADGRRAARPFLRGGSTGKRACARPALGARPRVTRAGSPAGDAQGLGLQTPAPDHPRPWGAAADGAEREGEDCLFRSRAEAGPAGAAPPAVQERGSAPFSVEGSWDSLPEAAAPSACAGEGGPARAAPAGLSGSGRQGARGSRGGGGVAEEDAAVAEALAALEAATAGEDAGEAD